MSKRNPATPPPPLTTEILSHRQGFERFVLDHAEPWHREHLGRLFSNWRAWNGEHFDGRLEPPYLLLAEPSNPRRLGDCGALSGFGGRSQIRIRPSLVRGSHPHVRAGERFAEGRERFVDDVLIHEMIHQWQFEVLGDSEPAYHGHGPLFRDAANRIGAALGLPAVRDCKRRGSGATLPSCAHWPHCVRPEGFYLGSLIAPGRRRAGDQERFEEAALRYLRRRTERRGDDDVLTDGGVADALRSVAAAVAVLTGSAGTFDADAAARLILRAAPGAAGVFA
jgi:hypothetical protein